MNGPFRTMGRVESVHFIWWSFPSLIISVSWSLLSQLFKCTDHSEPVRQSYRPPLACSQLYWPFRCINYSAGKFVSMFNHTKDNSDGWIFILVFVLLYRRFDVPRGGDLAVIPSVFIPLKFVHMPHLYIPTVNFQLTKHDLCLNSVWVRKSDQTMYRNIDVQ